MNDLKPQDSIISFNCSFVNRQSVFDEISKLWEIPSGTPRSLLLWGDRNMGKTSIIMNIKERCPGTNVAYFNFHLVYSTEQKEFWIGLARAVEKATNIASPPIKEFFTDPPHAVFSCYLENSLRERCPEEKMILAIDEYEGLETFFDVEAIVRQINDITIRTKNTALILCGAHEVDNLKVNIPKTTLTLKLGLLTQEESKNLTAIQPFTFEESATDLVHKLTKGQPGLLRSLCFELVCRHKWNLLDKGISAPVSIEEVRSVANDPEFYFRYRYYFSGMWNRLSPNEMAILKLLATEPQGLNLSEIAQKIKRSTKTATSLCVGILHMYNLIEKRENRYFVAIELFRRWILQFQL